MEYRINTLSRAMVAFTLILAALTTSTAVAEKVYRWVDEDGNVHYTESLPPGHKDTGHDVLNEQGIVVDEDQRLTPAEVEEKKTAEEIKEEEANELPRDSSGLPRPKPLYTEEEKQQRMDRLLLLRYDSEQEIADAMNVEIKQLNYDRRLLESTQESMLQAYQGQVRMAADKQRAGKPVSNEDSREIAKLQGKLAQTEVALAALNQREEDIRAEFQKQLDRYRFLVEKYAEENSS